MVRTQSGFRFKSTFVVLFDDAHAATRRAYLDAAYELGAMADAARDAGEAFAKAIALRPDAIVTDARITEEDPFALARRLRGDPRTAGIPVIATTSLVSRTLARHAEDCGCVALLTKPCSPELIARTLARVATERPRARLVC